MCKDAQRSCKFGFSIGLILGLTVKLVKKIWLIENSSVYLKKKNKINNFGCFSPTAWCCFLNLEGQNKREVALIWKEDEILF